MGAAPDKIYVSERHIGYEEVVDRVWLDQESMTPGITSIEYLRKETLLKLFMDEIYQHNEDSFDDGFNTAMGMVIDTINEL